MSKVILKLNLSSKENIFYINSILNESESTNNSPVNSWGKLAVTYFNKFFEDNGKLDYDLHFMDQGCSLIIADNYDESLENDEYEVVETYDPMKISFALDLHGNHENIGGMRVPSVQMGLILFESLKYAINNVKT